MKNGKTLSIAGSKIGEVGASSTFTVETGAKLACNNYPVTGAGNFNLQSGASISIGSAAGITSSGSLGNIQVAGTRTYNSGATYEYSGALSPQATGNFVTTITGATYPASVANLIINKSTSSAIVTLSNTTDITGNLYLTNGVLLTASAPATAPWIRITAAAGIIPDGGSASSYVDGYIRRTGATAFTFPTGNAGQIGRAHV